MTIITTHRIIAAEVAARRGEGARSHANSAPLVRCCTTHLIDESLVRGLLGGDHSRSFMTKLTTELLLNVQSVAIRMPPDSTYTAPPSVDVWYSARQKIDGVAVRNS